MRKTTIKPVHLEVLVDAAKRIVDACINNRLDCRDPALASTRLLYSMGHTQYLIRTLWKRLSRLTFPVILYKYENAIFHLVIDHNIEPLCSLEYNNLYVPLDALDALHIRHRGHDCIFTPRTHLVRVYLRGEVLEHVGIRINIIRLLYLIAQSLSLGKVQELLDGMIELIWKRDVRSIESKLIEFFTHEKYNRIISFFLPRVPRKLDDLLKVSPALRKLHASSYSP